MTWYLVVKKWALKSFAWCKQHWRWVVLTLAFLITYYLGRRKNQSLLIQAQLAKEQYKKEAEIIERAHQKELRLRDEAKKQQEMATSDLIRAKEREIEHLKERRVKETEKLNSSDKIDEELENMGIKKR